MSEDSVIAIAFAIFVLLSIFYIVRGIRGKMNEEDNRYWSIYEEGYDEGYNVGYTETYDDAFEAGYDHGQADGMSEGYEEGYEEGYNAGYSDGEYGYYNYAYPHYYGFEAALKYYESK